MLSLGGPADIPPAAKVIAHLIMSGITAWRARIAGRHRSSNALAGRSDALWGRRPLMVVRCGIASSLSKRYYRRKKIFPGNLVNSRCYNGMMTFRENIPRYLLSPASRLKESISGRQGTAEISCSPVYIIPGREAAPISCRWAGAEIIPATTACENARYRLKSSSRGKYNLLK